MTDNTKTTPDKVAAPAVSEPASSTKSPAEGVKAPGDSKIKADPSDPAGSKPPHQDSLKT